MTNNDDIKDSIIKTTDEEGNIHNFKLVEVIEIDEKEYGVFEYIEPEVPNKNSEDEEALVIMRIIHKEDNYYFEEIEDDDEFDKVIEYIEEYMDELELE